MASRKAKNPKTSVAMCPVCEKAVIDGDERAKTPSSVRVPAKHGCIDVVQGWLVTVSLS